MFDPFLLTTVIALGLLAGALTTIAGMGGGLVLLAALGLLFDPHSALAWTAPALLLGNLHRVWLYRHAVDLRAAAPLALGALPAAFLGGLVASALPPLVLAVALVGIGSLGLLKATGLLAWTPPTSATVPLGALAGLLVAAGGGAGVVMGPLLLARGLGSLAYVATMAALAVGLHSSRLLAYGLGGIADQRTLLIGGGVAVAIAAGNLVGDQLRRVLGPERQGHVQVAALSACVLLAVVEVLG